MAEKTMITAQSMRKLLQRAEKTLSVHDELKGVCRFVTLRYVQVETNETGKSIISIVDDKGLQMENTVYHLNGDISFIHHQSDLIVSVEEGIPAWASKKLITIYEAFHNRLKREAEQNI